MPVLEYALGITLSGVLSNNEIAAQLGISRRTVRTLRDRAMQKMQNKAKVIQLKRGLENEGEAQVAGSAERAVEEDGGMSSRMALA